MAYEARWMPESTADQDLAVAARWLNSVEQPGKKLLVVNVLKIAAEVPALSDLAKRYTLVSPLSDSRPSGGGHAVLAPWVVGDALSLAEELASSDGYLLVIHSDPPSGDVEAWIARTNAQRLV